MARSSYSRVWVYLILVTLAVGLLLPLVITFFGSFRGSLDIFSRGPLALPTSWNLSNYQKVFTEFGFGRFLLNTVIITAPTVVLSSFMAVMAAFALSFMEFPLQRPILLLITVVGIMVSEEFIMIPLYQLMNFFGLIDTYVAAILPQIAMSAAFSTLIIYSFFRGLPKEFIDAALVDGASTWQVLWRVLAPIAMPAIMTAMTLTATWTWNDYIIPLIMLPSPSKATLPLGLTIFQSAHTIDIPLTMAGTIITVLPMLIFYFLFQRQIIRGLTQGAVD
jgi:raffinose/stachyose/melibiose transport system permease protein